MAKRRNRKCNIQEGVKLVCPACGAVVTVPMCKAVNGELITCPVCQQEFSFES
ncbi:MAG TPA: hypothetical protein PKA10_10390 [Selenomonadales bacterium]|nr:hypothetical protein [Selenomonadales bacterium]